MTPNARHAIWDRDSGETVAIIEGTIPNARHAIRDRDGGETGAA